MHKISFSNFKPLIYTVAFDNLNLSNNSVTSFTYSSTTSGIPSGNISSAVSVIITSKAGAVYTFPTSFYRLKLLDFLNYIYTQRDLIITNNLTTSLSTGQAYIWDGITNPIYCNGSYYYSKQILKF